jgi:hypothetical protein
MYDLPVPSGSAVPVPASFTPGIQYDLPVPVSSAMSVSVTTVSYIKLLAPAIVFINYHYRYSASE